MKALPDGTDFPSLGDAEHLGPANLAEEIRDEPGATDTNATEAKVDDDDRQGRLIYDAGDATENGNPSSA